MRSQVGCQERGSRLGENRINDEAERSGEAARLRAFWFVNASTMSCQTSQTAKAFRAAKPQLMSPKPMLPTRLNVRIAPPDMVR